MGPLKIPYTLLYNIMDLYINITYIFGLQKCVYGNPCIFASPADAARCGASLYGESLYTGNESPYMNTERYMAVELGCKSALFSF